MRSQISGSGVLLPGVVARVVKADGALAGYDEPGELVIKTPSVALGYANNLKACVYPLVSSISSFADIPRIGPRKPSSTGTLMPTLCCIVLPFTYIRIY